MPAAYFFLSENGLIRNARDWPDADLPADQIVVPDAVFAHLKRLATNATGPDDVLTFLVQKGYEAIRVQSYAGLLRLPGGTQLEILPKIDTDEPASPADRRRVLLNMLRYVRDTPFRTLTTARTAASSLPLWDVFVNAFLDTLEPLVRSGIQRSYVAVEQNEPFWRGKFQYARHQRENAQHAERLAVRYEHLTTDTPPNRLLKTALQSVATNPPTGVLRSTATTERLRAMGAAWQDVPPSARLADDWAAVTRLNRLFARYEPALRWADALLGGQAFGAKAGPVLNVSLLFPMPRVFEEYVAHGIRTYWPGGTVTVQESSAHLVDEHGGAPKFKLRPDILIRDAGRTLVLDTKWKDIDGRPLGAGPGSYGIEQADLYQLYAYGKKYEAADLFLVYPASARFREPLAVFGYDATTRLHVVPFDVTVPLAKAVETLARYALTG